MLAVKYLLKLYDMPPENGQISAFDTYGNTVFTGTDRGVLLKFIVEGAVSPDAVQKVTAEAVNGNSKPGLRICTSSTQGQTPKEDTRFDVSVSASQLEKIYTTLVQRTVLTQGQRKIERIQHSRTHNLIFVLCEQRLLVLNSVNFSMIQTIAHRVGTFFVSDSRQNAQARSGCHVICATALHSRELRVFEFDVSQGKQSRASLVQELVLPEPVQVLVTYGNIACVGMRGGYCLLSLVDGNSCGVLPLGKDKHPLLAAGDGEVFMRYDQSIFSVSMRSMPSGRVLGRTIQLGDEARHVMVRHPFLFAFTEHYCDVYSLYDDDVSERLPLPGCLYGSQLGRGDFLYVASGTKIWMAGLHSLRHQLADLVEQFKVEEAFHLLDSQRSRSTLDWQGIELELHIMVGFAYLHRCRPKEAMLHFNDHIDPRDLLLLLPECIPPGPDEYSSELREFLERYGAKRTQDEVKGSASSLAVDTGVRQEGKVSASSMDESSRSGSNSMSDTHVTEGFWSGWEGCCPYNTYAGELEKAWLETFDTFPLLPRSGIGKEEVAVRQVTEWGAINSETFIQRSWEAFKDEITIYFRSRLSYASSVYARAMEYALLVLALESKDHRSAYRVVTSSSSLRIEDCYDMLCMLREYRLLACLLHRRGYVHYMCHILETRVLVSSLLPPHVKGDGRLSGCRPAYQCTPANAHVLLDRLLQQQTGGLNVVGTQSPAYSKPMFVGDEGALSSISADDTSSLPPSLSEVMYLIEQLNISALQELLLENQEAVTVVDEEGNSILHVLFSLFSVLDFPPSEDDSERSAKAAALLNLILPCTLMFMDHGATTSTVNLHGLTCLDVLAVVQGGAFFDVVVSVLLAGRDIREATVAASRQQEGLAGSHLALSPVREGRGK
ncbi:hypothetical protein ERJ75_000954600 [Trypanosoma vivax]|nr:hypothetical protein ERJ75_000954600 [Trypanosoma vivax]